MHTSPLDKVRKMYQETADSYAQMMDAEFELPVYADVLGRLRERIANIEGPIIDTACGTGHMLSLYREQYHHLDVKGAKLAFGEWFRVLAPSGQLVVAAWEGSGPVDYGEESDIVALRYTSTELEAWAECAGFVVTRCAVEPVDEFPMDALYLEAHK